MRNVPLIPLISNMPPLTKLRSTSSPRYPSKNTPSRLLLDNDICSTHFLDISTIEKKCFIVSAIILFKNKRPNGYKIDTVGQIRNSKHS